MRVPISIGNNTNRASDGMVNTTLAAAVVSRRAIRVRCTSMPSGSAIASPISTGTNASHRCTAVSARASSRWVNR
jgi:hypothetical protein